jgi:hypothetical protein
MMISSMKMIRYKRICRRMYDRVSRLEAYQMKKRHLACFFREGREIGTERLPDAVCWGHCFGRAGIYTLLDEVHPPRKGHVLRCALGYIKRDRRRIKWMNNVMRY